MFKKLTVAQLVKKLAATLEARTFIVLFYVRVTVHHESKVKREATRCNQSDVYSQIFISTCFGHHYAHLQENKNVNYRSLVLLKMGIMMPETC
jgi:hypothetical protein